MAANGQVASGHGGPGADPERSQAGQGAQVRGPDGTEEADSSARALASLDDRLVDFHGRFLAASRAFLRAPSMGAMELLLAAYTLWHNARYGSEAGLDSELERIKTQCRNILAGLP